MKPKVLVTRQVFPEIVEALRSRFDVEHNDDDRPWPTDELARRVADKQGVLATVMDRIDDGVLAAAPGPQGRLQHRGRHEQRRHPGVHEARHPRDQHARRARRHDRRPHLGAAHGRGAPHRRGRRAGAPGRLEARLRDAVAPRHRRAPRHARHHRHGPHRPGDRAARRRLRHAGRSTTTAAASRRPTRSASTPPGSSATGCWRNRDFVVVMVPYSPAVHHLIGAAEIARMKPTAILVNTARGGVVDDAALVEALKAKRIAGAGLDVFEGEPKLNPGLPRRFPTSSSRRTSAAPRAPRA